MSGRTLLLMLALLATTGCRRVLMPTPIIFAESNVDPFPGVADDELSRVEVFYATDRAPHLPEQSTYGFGRSETLAVGRATVRIGSKLEPERLRAEMAPRREEIARMQEEIRDQLEPLREQMRELGEKVREDLERWREER